MILEPTGAFAAFSKRGGGGSSVWFFQVLLLHHSKKMWNLLNFISFSLT